MRSDVFIPVQASLFALPADMKPCAGNKGMTVCRVSYKSAPQTFRMVVTPDSVRPASDDTEAILVMCSHYATAVLVVPKSCQSSVLAGSSVSSTDLFAEMLVKAHRLMLMA